MTAPHLPEPARCPRRFWCLAFFDPGDFVFFTPGDFVPPDPLARSLAGTPTPRSVRAARSHRSLAIAPGDFDPVAGPLARLQRSKRSFVRTVT